MTEKPSIKFTEKDVEELARDIGKPLPGNLKQRVMAKVHAKAVELAKSMDDKVKKGK